MAAWLARLKAFLSNSWMTNGDFKGAAAHFLGGYGVLMTAGFLWRSLPTTLLVWVGLLLYTLLKEFVYDVHFEVPPQDVKGGLMDFKWYHVGASLAVAIQIASL